MSRVMFLEFPALVENVFLVYLEIHYCCYIVEKSCLERQFLA